MKGDDYSIVVYIYYKAPTRADSNWWIWFPNKTETFRPPTTRLLSFFQFYSEMIWVQVFVFFFFYLFTLFVAFLYQFFFLGQFVWFFFCCCCSKSKRVRAIFFFWIFFLVIWYSWVSQIECNLQIILIEKWTKKKTAVIIDAVKFCIGMIENKC